MAGYIGKSQGVTQVDGYNRSEADAEFVDVTGDTMTGNLTVSSGGSTFTVADANGYVRATHNNGSAQVGLFRTGTDAGGGYIGADGNNCLDVRDAAFASRFVVSQLGLITTGKTPAVARNHSANVSTSGARVVCGFGNTVLDNIGSSTFGSYAIRPQLSGYYLLAGQLVATGSSPSAWTPVIHVIKNGTTVYSPSYLINYTGGHSLTLTATIIVSANGSSDYFEIGFSHNNGTSYTVNGGNFALFRLGDL